MTDLIDTTEMYLKTIFELEEEGITPLRARIAERLGHSGPTVSQTVARMERDGLLSLAGDRHLELSEHGRLLATRVMRKHRLAERLLVDVIGLEWEYVHDEACRWEHVMSERVERKILALLARPPRLALRQPHPRPRRARRRRAQRGLPHRPAHARPSWPARPPRRCSCAASASRSRSTTRRSRLLTVARLLPGERVRVRRDGGRVVAVREGAPESTGVSLPDDVAQHVFGALV